jgi:hypothetical protein
MRPLVKKAAATRTQILLSFDAVLNVFQPDTARRIAEARRMPIRIELGPMVSCLS